MRVHRRPVVVTLLASGVMAIWLGLIAVNYHTSALQEDAAQTAQDGLTPPANLDPEARTAAERDGGPSGFAVFLAWAGAVGSSGVFLGSFILFRVEVRREKDVLRNRKTRSDYHKDLKRYNAQLKGPPRQNT